MLHTFVIPAYRESPYLERCIDSLKKQSAKSVLILATSTPSPLLEETARKHGIEYCVNPEQGGGIAADWSFALSCCRTRYCTLAHQDDVYLPRFAEKCVAALERNPPARMAFADYADCIGEDDIRPHRLYLWVKRLLLWPFYLRRAWRSTFVKRHILRFGSPVCCPGVTYNLELGEIRFDRSFSVNPDWAMWLTLAAEKGTAFVFIPEFLLYHRISGGMETAAAIRDNRRANEDIRLFARLWPGWVVKILARLYALSYRSNRVG